MVARTVAETGSTNADMLALAAAGEAEGAWLRAGRQTGGRGREGRAWVSPEGNFYGSTLVRLRPPDPPAATLALMAGVAVHEAVAAFLSPSPFRGFAAPSSVGSAMPPAWPGQRGALSTRRSHWEREQPAAGGRKGEGDGVAIKWPNDLLLGGAKLAGILLERAGDAVVVGIGVNLAHQPAALYRPVTSLAEHGIIVHPEIFAETLADTFARWLARWRGEGLAAVRTAWLAAAHPVGTALNARLPGGEAIDGLFDGLSPDGALLLRLAGGERRAIHAGDVFLL